MDSSGGQNQEMSSDSLGNMLVVGPKASGQGQPDRKPRPQPEQALKCPRCESTNTKFCYYNNYSLTQPRYFCKACRRYWTKGGTLRNVPVGGGCRKNRRSASSSASGASSATTTKRGGPHDHQNPLHHPTSYIGALDHHSILPSASFQLPLGGYDQNDLTLAFARLQKSSCAGQLGSFDNHQQQQISILGNIPNSTGNDIVLGMSSNGNSTASTASGFLDALRSGLFEPSSSYYGFGNGSDHGNNMGGGFTDYRDDDDHDHDQSHQDQVTTTSTNAVTVTTIKQELCNGNNVRSDHNDHYQTNNSRMMWGCPWQINSNGSDHQGICLGSSGNMADFDPSTTGRESWNGFASSWHGLLNTTPLM